MIDQRIGKAEAAGEQVEITPLGARFRLDGKARSGIELDTLLLGRRGSDDCVEIDGVGKFLFEEEVISDRELRRPAEARGSLTKFMTIIIIALSLESLVLITNADGLDGHKVALIVLPFLCLTYLFYLSVWFRNSVFFPIAQKMRQK